MQTINDKNDKIKINWHEYGLYVNCGHNLIYATRVLALHRIRNVYPCPMLHFDLHTHGFRSSKAILLRLMSINHGKPQL